MCESTLQTDSFHWMNHLIINTPTNFRLQKIRLSAWCEPSKTRVEGFVAGALNNNMRDSLCFCPLVVKREEKKHFQWAILSWNIPNRTIGAWQPKLGVNHSLKFCPWTVCLSLRLWGQDNRQTGCWGGFHGYSWASLWPDCWKKKQWGKTSKRSCPVA